MAVHRWVRADMRSVLDSEAWENFATKFLRFERADVVLRNCEYSELSTSGRIVNKSGSGIGLLSGAAFEYAAAVRQRMAAPRAGFWTKSPSFVSSAIVLFNDLVFR